MKEHVRSIGNRMDLRPPLREALDLMAEATHLLDLQKEQPAEAALAAIQSRFPNVKGFERDFPSLCFNIATGVGKTRLMGAFITYLYKTYGMRHFFIVAPNLTIYEKLKHDFQPGHAGYVLKGLSEFASNPPEVITGENYDTGRGVRADAARQQRLHPENDVVHVNIFNISKINKDAAGLRQNKGTTPKMKRLSEMIGQSYFDYLASLDDLVILMDESHRYRAEAGMAALNVLNPVLGLELTATAQTMKGKKVIPFQNILYLYMLGQAMKDGYVKQPAVVTRQDLDIKGHSDEEIERLKLEDGLRVIHHNTKTALAEYAINNQQPRVKPFALVVARDTKHADELLELIQQDDFLGGDFKGKVIAVHTNQSGQESDENIQLLLEVEQPDNPIEVVIHVNMLSEGWDVKNLYTIIPLKKFDSKTLVEQSMGRGLRLPYGGKRTGHAEVDRLSIIAHDSFQDVLDYARSEDSIINTVILDDDSGTGRRKVNVETKSRLQTQLESSDGDEADADSPFKTPEDREIATRINRALDEGDLQIAAAADQVEAVKKTAEKAQEAGIAPTTDQAQRVLSALIGLRSKGLIHYPRIMRQPKGEVKEGYRDFDLDVAALPHITPVPETMKGKDLSGDGEFHIRMTAAGQTTERIENILLHLLRDRNEINDTRDGPLLHKLARQAVEHLQTRFGEGANLRNLVEYHRIDLVAALAAQLEANRFEEADWEYKAEATTPRVPERSLKRDESSTTMRCHQRPANLSEIKHIVFETGDNCVYPYVKFDSNPERVFAVILESEGSGVLKWLRPRAKEPYIPHAAGDYEPDFLVETEDEKLIIEVKRDDMMDESVVLDKARAAAKWCREASKFEAETSGKPWRYALIPEQAIDESKTLSGLIEKWKFGAEPELSPAAL